MRDIALVTMPFADRRLPSFGLSQLAALVRRDLGDEFAVRVCYANHDFVRFLGPQLYDAITGDLSDGISGIGDWLFRAVAFPDDEDNVEQYVARFLSGPEHTELREAVLRSRRRLYGFCEEIAHTYRLAEADVVGFSTMFAQTVPSLAMARLVKDLNPAALTVLGGANCEAPMGAVLAEHADQIDFVFSGPALHSFPDFLRCVAADDLDRAHTIPGVVCGKTARDPRHRTALGRQRDIEDYVEPDYSAFIESFDAMRESGGEADLEPLLFFETSRGCWWGERSHCTFCGLNGQGMAFRGMSPATALRQFERLFAYAPWCRNFNCTDNIMPMEYLTEVFPKLSPPPGVTLFYEVKVGLDQEDLRAMARAGVTAIQPGIEALNTGTLKLMRKGTSTFQNIQLLKNCVRYGITPSWNLLIGFPGEPEETFRKYARDLPKLTHLPPPDGCWPVRFDRYSPYFNQAESYGLDLEPLDYYRLTYPFPVEDLSDLAYYFVDRGAGDYMVAAAQWSHVLRALVAQWHAAWDGPQRPQLVLARDADGAHVVDTRGGEARKIPLDADALALLELLDRPVRIDRLGDGLPAGTDAEAALAVLTEHDLVLLEGVRAMSLVFSDSAQDPMPRPRRRGPERALVTLEPVSPLGS